MDSQLFEDICFALERTHKGLLTICKEHGLNTESPFRNYLNNNPEAELRYARAREKQIDYLEDLLRELVFEDKKDKEVIDKVNIGSNFIARDRLKADTLKFILSKLRPQKYGTKIEIDDKREPRVFKLD
jgi:hypothetical protein